MLKPGQYIPLNPVKAGLASLPEDWEFSRYREYVGMRSGTLPRVDGVRSLFGDEVCHVSGVLGGAVGFGVAGGTGVEAGCVKGSRNAMFVGKY